MLRGRAVRASLGCPGHDPQIQVSCTGTINHDGSAAGLERVGVEVVRAGQTALVTNFNGTSLVPVQSQMAEFHVRPAGGGGSQQMTADPIDHLAGARWCSPRATKVCSSPPLVAPSERVELVVRFRPHDAVVLRSHPTGLGAGRLPRRFAGGDDTFDLLRLTSAGAIETLPQVAETLPAPPAVRPPAGAVVRTFTFNHASRINGRPYDHRRVDFSVAPGAVEVWRLRNSSDNQHVFHVHGVSFSVLEYDGRPPPARLRGLKDSVLLPPETTARLAVALPRHVDAAVPYVFHCHVLAHEDHGMMGQYTVTPTAALAGQAPRRDQRGTKVPSGGVRRP